MSETLKINGFVEKRAVTWWNNGEEHITVRKGRNIHQSIPEAEVILIIGISEKPPRVFTEGDVREMLADAFDGSMGAAQGITWKTMQAIAAKHGITL